MKFMRAATEAVLALLGTQQLNAPQTFTPARPPAAPLAVRSPYLNVWMNGDLSGSSGNLPSQWPRYWTKLIHGWQGYVLVDGKAYSWMGNYRGAERAVQQSVEYTSTKTIFKINVGNKIQMLVKFISPVFPTDFRRQSVTSSYLEVSVKSSDGKNHQVKLYCDVSGEWASGDANAHIQWSNNTSDGVLYHKFWRKQQSVFAEAHEIPSWGNWYWATAQNPSVTYQVGQDSLVRAEFISKGKLSGHVDNKFRGIRDKWPVFAFSRDLGNLNKNWVNTLYTIGYTQEEAILFQGQGDAPQRMPSLWKDHFAENKVVSFFYKDFNYALRQCNDFDSKIAKASKEVGGRDYATITTLAVRQVFGALQFTGTKKKPMIFLKEISSNSDIQTVDVIYPTMPILLYLNPDLLRYLLDPLLENMKYQYPNDYAQHDLGTFPNAVGYPKGDDEAMPLEECGNMVIMMLAYAQAKNSSDYLVENWDLLSKWANYLIRDSRVPMRQLSTDDFAGKLANQTNLAIKGIIALQAMSRIADLTGHATEKKVYSDTAHEYLEFWTKHAVNDKAEPKHSMLQYDSPDSYGLLYNLYADKLLGLGLIPDSIYDMQSDFYLSKQDEYGVVLDTRNNFTKVDWQMFAAAVAKKETRDMFISKIAKWIGKTSTTRAFTDLYDVKTGGYPKATFVARPVVGGVFALLALNKT